MKVLAAEIFHLAPRELFRMRGSFAEDVSVSRITVATGRIADMNRESLALRYATLCAIPNRSNRNCAN